MIVLDNDVLAGFVRPNPDPDVLSYLSDHSTEQWIVPTIVLYEFLSYYDSSKQTRRRRQLKKRVDGIVPFDEDAAAAAANIEGSLQSVGTSLDTADLFIAAIARERSGTLATRNHQDFDKTPIHQLLDIDIVR
ncbi:type II toxin-antitoxin system VapC family toxin [Halomicrobium salinisoli]|uniref:type II toxin-antitoxin system VapC family toxin n=1 Tax=Halomicrobium salinisoli TaxID=2878391 RepID=UPI001CF0C620|nr:type II toxin-antitoxin system VapC family toxin [Halomicrobium salinisoli]